MMENAMQVQAPMQAQTMNQAPEKAQEKPKGAMPSAALDIYKRVMMAAMKIIYTDPKPFLDMIQSAEDPAKGIIAATDIVMDKIEKSVQGVPPEAMQQVVPIIKKQVGPMIGKLFLELANAAGILGDQEEMTEPQDNPQEEAAESGGLIAGAQQQRPMPAGA